MMDKNIVKLAARLEARSLYRRFFRVTRIVKDPIRAESMKLNARTGFDLCLFRGQQMLFKRAEQEEVEAFFKDKRALFQSALDSWEKVFEAEAEIQKEIRESELEPEPVRYPSSGLPF
mmetsp:Transcript_9297/g.27995  ORF Transcript_9297/g.27995 Transcript_9297/m.27995 type:complete len:118 (-) Transcript_9297:169-522(-)